MLHRIRPVIARRRLPSAPGLLRAWSDVEDPLWFEKLPDHIKRNLAKAAVDDPLAFQMQGSGASWEEVISAPTADGTAITSSSETILIPDFSIPASFMVPGRILKYTIMGRQSTVITTPGTITLRLRWGGVGGVSLAASGAFAPDPTAAATNLTWMVEWWTQCRTAGASGTAMTWGRVEWSDYDDASAGALVGNLNMRMIPTSAPATATIDTTIDKLLSATYQSSVATASVTAHAAVLEAMN